MVHWVEPLFKQFTTQDITKASTWHRRSATLLNLIGFMEIVFAYEFNCFNDFGLNEANATLHAEMDQCQRELHKCGKANQVSFDPAKESKHILAFERRRMM